MRASPGSPLKLEALPQAHELVPAEHGVVKQVQVAVPSVLVHFAPLSTL